MPISTVILAINKNIIVEACKIQTSSLNGIQFFKLFQFNLYLHVIIVLIAEKLPDIIQSYDLILIIIVIPTIRHNSVAINNKSYNFKYVF